MVFENSFLKKFFLAQQRNRIDQFSIFEHFLHRAFEHSSADERDKVVFLFFARQFIFSANEKEGAGVAKKGERYNVAKARNNFGRKKAISFAVSLGESRTNYARDISAQSGSDA